MCDKAIFTFSQSFKLSIPTRIRMEREEKLNEENVRHMFVEWTSLDFCCWCLVPEVYKLPYCTNTNLIKFHSINCNGNNDSIITQYPSNRSLFSALKLVQCTWRTCFKMFFPLFEKTNPECPHHRSHQNRWQRQSLHLSYKTIINRLSALRVLHKWKRALTTRGCRDTSSGCFASTHVSSTIYTRHTASVCRQSLCATANAKTENK